MMPIGTTTQIPVPTQPTMVATPVTGSTAVYHAPPSAVAASVANDKVMPDAKGNGMYIAPASPTASPALPVSAPLATPIPASFTTNAASLSASAMFAAQAMAQDPSVYETMLAASEVKYKPSNATAPEPAPNNLFAKMLAEEQSHMQPAARVAQQAAAAAPAQAAQTPAPKATAPTPRKSESQTQAAVRSVATHAYSTTNSRNSTELGEAKIDEAPSV